MFVQVTNPRLKRNNTFRATLKTMIPKMRERGWTPSDCKVVELRDELVTTKYKGADGKTTSTIR